MPYRASITTVPAPTGGLNAFDNYMAMEPTDAIKLVNLVPSPYGCTVRKGFKKHSKKLDAPVESLVPHANSDGTTKLFAFAGGAMYDTSLNNTASEELSGLANSSWQYASIANSAGTHTVMFNGADAPIWYHDGNIKRLTSGDGTGDGTWKNVDPENLVQGVVHQRRLWAVERDSTNGWYLAADSFYGEASFFDFGPFFRRGGYLAMLGTWSADVGEGSDDHLVAVSSEGEAAVFAGLDPSDPNSWQLRGVFYVGVPVKGRRFMTNVGGDLLILTVVGVVSMATVLMSNTVAATADTAYSKKVQHLLNKEIISKKTLDGWELHFHSEDNLLFVNIPTLFSGRSNQMVANYINQAWCVYSGMAALCWVSIGGRQFYGSQDGYVYEAGVGNLDNQDHDGDNGTYILSECQQAYNYFGALGAQKQVGMYKPTFLANQRPGFVSDVTYDFKAVVDVEASAVGNSSHGDDWDNSNWDVSRWTGAATAFAEWRSAQGIGNAVTLRIALSTWQDTTWVGTDYTMQIGGPL